MTTATLFPVKQVYPKRWGCFIFCSTFWSSLFFHRGGMVGCCLLNRGSITVSEGRARAGDGRFLGLESQGEGKVQILVLVFLFTVEIVSKSISTTSARLCLRQLPSNVVLGAEAFPALLEGGKVSGSHHAGTVSGGARYGQWSGNLHLGSIKEAGLVITLKGVGVGCRTRVLVPCQA